MPPFHHPQEASAEEPTVAVELRDAANRWVRLVAHVPVRHFMRYAPPVISDTMTMHNHTTLLLPLQNTDHVDDVEIPGLHMLFASWARTDRRPQAKLARPEHSIGESILMYRAMQLLSSPHAQTLRQDIMSRINAEPLTETDVQRIWWSMQFTQEWAVWLDVVMRNIVGFKLLKKQPGGGYIWFFIDTEIHRLDNEAHRNCIVAAYERHRQFRKSWAQEQLPARFGRLLRRVLG
ncbi:hypothetical protein IQ07DRAFT_521920 [Pyrenochaeta sp. DS3sAY3a]|nr:hypothetical protein IQ07DRAFT_521920 [Pyrenochaeta sp. DS3sAY3a]